ncbi:MAG: CaiB/BaiF CoA transferase family protein [Dehalococcoidia bacterium]
MPSSTTRWPPLVVDFTAAWAGPLCGAVLADLGWTVVKIESATRPDITRRLGPFADGIAGLERSGYFDSLNRGKRSVALNLRTAEGQELARALSLEADVVVENFSPGVMARLGLDYSRLSALKPALVMLSISGYGATGPERDYVAYGQTIEAVAGLDAATGYPGAGPMASGSPLPDHVAGMTGAFAVLQAVDHQRRTGEGAYLDVSMLEALLAMMPLHLFAFQLTGREPEPRANRDAAVAPHGCYPCLGEDQWLALSAGSPAEWRALCAELGLMGFLSDEALLNASERLRRQDEIDPAIAAATRTREAHALVSRLRTAGVPATVVAQGADLLDDETLRQRAFFTEVETTEAGPRVLTGRPASFSFLAEPLRSAGPRLGEHTREILESVLGLSPAEIDGLDERGILA